MYFEQTLERVMIGNKEFPVKIDMFVLEKIQEKYGNINDFELKVKGLVPTNEVNSDGKILYDHTEPNIAAMNCVLPLMVREGCDIENIDLTLTDKEIVREVKATYTELGLLIAREFDKCFDTGKKETPSK